MALYRGDLLPGFYIEEAPEFDQWLERERARLRGRALQATRLLSEREEAAGQLGPAVEWARRAATLEPFDESVVRRIMTLLGETADRAGALRTYDEFAARLRTELDAEPAAETVALMEAIRDRRTVASSSLAAPAVVSPTPAPMQSTPAALTPPRGLRSPAMMFGMAAAALVLGATGWSIMGRGKAANATPSAATVAVFPFRAEGGGRASTDRLGDAMVTLMSERLNNSGVLQAVNSRAMRAAGRAFSPQVTGGDSARAVVSSFRPRFVLLGEIRSSGDSIRIDAALFDSTARLPVARASASGVHDDIARIAAELSDQLLTARPTRRSPIWDRSPPTLTSSVPALRAFLAGDRKYAEGHFAEAMKEYKTAVDADTTFALAYLFLGRSANWAGDYVLEEFASKKAMDNLERLTPIDQLLVRAWDAYMHVNPAETERLSRLILVNDPAVPDAWFALGEVRFHWGPVLGWTIPEAREAYERSNAISSRAGTLVHLTRIAAAQGRGLSADSLARRALATGVDVQQSLEVRAIAAYATGNRAEIDRVLPAIARLDRSAAYSVATQVAVYAAEFAGVQRVASMLRAPRYHALDRAGGALMEVQLAMARGNISEAERILATSTGLTPARVLEYRTALALLPFRNVPAADLARLRDPILRLPRDSIIGNLIAHFPSEAIFVGREKYLLGMIAIRTGDIAEAERIIEWCAARQNDSERHSYWPKVTTLLRAEILRAAGKTGEALAALGAPREMSTFPGVLEYNLAHERYLRAELLRSLGRWSEALRWYETFPDPGAYDLPYLGAAHAGRGAVLEQLGQRDAARAAYQRVIDLWSGADAELAPIVAHARERVSALR